MSIAGYGVIGSGDSYSGEYFDHFLPVPEGKVVLGGGAQIPDTHGRLISCNPVVQNGNEVIGWSAHGHNVDPLYGPVTLNVYMIVADA